MAKPTRMHGGLVLLAVLCAFSFGAIVKVALADPYHVACVGHGFVGGSDPSDGSFFSRVENGCSSTWRECKIYSGGSYIGSEIAADTFSTCNAWSRNWGTYTECASYAKVNNPGVFTEHNHLPTSPC